MPNDDLKPLLDVLRDLRSENKQAKRDIDSLIVKIEQLEGDLHQKEVELSSAQDEVEALRRDLNSEWNLKEMA